MATTTEKLLKELNTALGLTYPQVGYQYYADVTGFGGSHRPTIWVIINKSGGVDRSDLNAATSRKRCDNIREAIRHAPHRKAVNKLVTDLSDSAIRMDNDAYGNPRYYIPFYMFPEMADKVRSKAGLHLYRGKRYGKGYVIQAYSLKHELQHVANTVIDALNVQ